MRFMFDFIGALDTVPGTYVHNSIYSPNPIYNINPDTSINATTVLCIKYDNYMFSDLFPSFDSNDYKIKQLNILIFNEKNNNDTYKMNTMNK